MSRFGWKRPRLAGLAAAAQENAAPPPLKLSLQARAYFGLVAAGAAAAAGLSLAHLRFGTPGWATFAIFTAAAAVAQLFIVEKGSNQSYRTAIVFILAAAVVLRPGFVVLLAALHYVPGWIKFRKKWLVQGFNICNTMLAVLAARGVFHALAGASLLGGHPGRYALAGITACAAFVGVNHLLLAGIIRLTSGKPLLQTGLFSFESLSTDLGLATLGIGVAAFWSLDQWLVLFVLAPLFLIHRALYVPQLQEKARVDPKTGLLNAKEFEALLDAELAHAARTEAPLSLLMCDLDLLREINNTHGHLAGDIVIKGIADVFREQVRRYDVPSRFGGEEFSILLPETAPEHAMQIAERIRRAIADRQFEVEGATEPLHASVSIGVAGFPRDATGRKELVHRADLAVYRAKAAGRNRVVLSSPEDEEIEAPAAPVAAAG